MRTGYIYAMGGFGRHRQGDVIFFEPTNREMRRLAEKQEKQAKKEDALKRPQANTQPRLFKEHST